MSAVRYMCDKNGTPVARRTPGTLTSRMFNTYRSLETATNGGPSKTPPTATVPPTRTSFSPQLNNVGTIPRIGPLRTSFTWTQRLHRSQSVLEPRKENSAPKRPAFATTETLAPGPSTAYNNLVRYSDVFADTLTLCSITNNQSQSNIQQKPILLPIQTPSCGVTKAPSNQSTLFPLSKPKPTASVSQITSLEKLMQLPAPSVFPVAPAIPFYITKHYFIQPTQVSDSIYDAPVDAEETLKKFFLFQTDLKPHLIQHSEAFQVQVRFTQMNRNTKKIEKCCVKTKMTLNGHPLYVRDFKFVPQLNPIATVPREALEMDANVIHAEWHMNDLPEDQDLYFSLEIAQKLSDTEMLAVVLERNPIPFATTVNMIKGVIDRSVMDGVMESGSYMEVSLVCPLGKSKMNSPCRATTCSHYSCFDTESFLHMTKVHPTWKCPVCNSQINYDDIRIDRLFEDIVLACGSDIQRAQINSNGDWKPIKPIENNKIRMSSPIGIGYKENNLHQMSIIEIDEDEDEPMDLTTTGQTATTLNIRRPRQSIEIIFEKPVKRFKPN